MRRPKQYRNYPFIDYWVGRLTQYPLTWLATRALNRGNLHEFQHLAYMVLVGNSNHDVAPCCLPNPMAPLGDTITLVIERSKP